LPNAHTETKGLVVHGMNNVCQEVDKVCQTFTIRINNIADNVSN
jgi:hypothetical protein